MGSVTLNGATSGQITLQPTAVAGTNTITLPAATGTVLTTAGGQNVNSSIGINGTTSGTITLAVPSVAGTNTITLAAQTGTLNAAGPAFSASMSATQTPALSANTKLVFDSEDFDTNNNYDPTTNYRFTPTVAGYYQVNLCTSMSCAGAGANFGVVIFKNGSAYKASVGNNTANYWTPLSVSAVISMNGTTDYLEAYVASGVSQVTVYATRTVATTLTVSSFSACLIRGA